jgi:hypothetical protein
MEFDLLVRKYLRGTLSSSELERLRDLLERVPEYRTELRQILELRSIIHDDALRLVPPRDLSDRTRETVGAQFAGLESLLQHDADRLATPGDLSDATRMAVGQLFTASASVAPVVLVEEEEEPKRRAVILPYRVMGRALVAASFAIIVALAPTLLTPTLDESGRGIAANDRTTSPLSGAPQGASVSRAPASDVDEITPLADAPQDAGSLRTASNAAAIVRSNSSSRRVLDARSSSRDDVASGIAATVDASSPYGPSMPAELAEDIAAAAMPPLDPDNPLSNLLRPRVSLGGLYNPARDTASRMDQVAVLELGPTVIAGVESDARLLAVGVTLGSGNVMDADAPAALMQNSYYFSFNVSGTDRIGIEMGGSKFMQETQVPGKRPVGNIFAKLGAGDTTGNSSKLTGGGATPTVNVRVEQDITYGGVFYDRRLEVDRAWDLCGRVTFGAADGALVAGVRAYTAYSPTKNVTLTLGIGGSTLFNLASRNDEASTNYGLYYGVETGF